MTIKRPAEASFGPLWWEVPMEDQKEIDQVTELDLGYVPEAAISAAFLMQDEHQAILTFNAMQVDEDGWRKHAGTAIVEFEGLLITRFGYPNDEARAGHPLYIRGLGGYRIYRVESSSWVAQLQAQNRVHFPDDTTWVSSEEHRHFVITFHDGTFECIAKEITLTVSQDSFASIVANLSERFDY
jgi:hypothetical protein